jgi:hypothetical protein
MYLFTSAIFFLVFFSLVTLDKDLQFDDGRIMSKEERFEASAGIYAAGKEAFRDSLKDKTLALLLDTTKSIWLEKVETKIASDSGNLVMLHNKPYLVFPYDDSIATPRNSRKIRWIENRLERKWQTYKQEYGDDVNKMVQDTSSRFLHWFPYILFVSLPAFALILKLLYRRRKTYYYSDHAVFTLYHYIFSFILLLLFWSFELLHQNTGWWLFQFLQTLLTIAWPLYLVIAMKRFYMQGWGKTFIKFLLVNLLGILSLLVIFVFFTLLFIYQL